MLLLVGRVLLGLILGYLFGCIPVGYFIGRMYGVDVRQYGSGRTGGSNVLRTVGWFAFLLTILGDALKGILPVLFMAHVAAPTEPSAAAAAVVGILVGNNWSVVIAWLAHPTVNTRAASNAYDSLKSFFARAKGGAGVITTAGAALAVWWPAIIPLVIIGVAILILFRYSSLASITVAALYPLDMAYFVLTGSAPWVYLLMSVIASAIVLYVLKPNMERLLAGTERRFGERVELH